MDFKVLKRLISMVEKSAIDELEIEEDNLKVRIKKNTVSSNYAAEVITTAQQVTAAPQPAQTTASVPQGQVEAAALPPVEDEGTEPIVSPMVGTFYISPSPGKPPYVQEGDVVKKGDVLCVIEAMKLMNEIESTVEGKVTSIMVDNAQPVEFGERLFLISPS